MRLQCRYGNVGARTTLRALSGGWPLSTKGAAEHSADGTNLGAESSWEAESLGKRIGNPVQAVATDVRLRLDRLGTSRASPPLLFISSCEKAGDMSRDQKDSERAKRHEDDQVKALAGQYVAHSQSKIHESDPSAHQGCAFTVAAGVRRGDIFALVLEVDDVAVADADRRAATVGAAIAALKISASCEIESRNIGPP